MLAPADVEDARQRALGAVGRVLRLGAWPEIPVRWNRRLRRAGRAVIDGSGRSFVGAAVELSPAYFEVYPDDLQGILIHEVTHIGLAIRGLPFGHGADFRRTCSLAGGLLHGRALPGKVFHYRCPTCGSILPRRRRLARDRWCAECVELARGRPGVDPYASERALVLVGTGFSGEEPPPDGS